MFPYTKRHYLCRHILIAQFEITPPLLTFPLIKRSCTQNDAHKDEDRLDWHLIITASACTVSAAAFKWGMWQRTCSDSFTHLVHLFFLCFCASGAWLNPPSSSSLCLELTTCSSIFCLTTSMLTCAFVLSSAWDPSRYTHRLHKH